jgi:glycosyltransferase involved in cell wall biosynthesis
VVRLGIGGDARYCAAPVPERPVLLLAYAGVLGGAERVLLDCATRLPRPALVACPDGALAAAAEAAGLAVVRLPQRTLRRGPAHAAGLIALARDARRLEARHRPAVLVAWGARAGLAVAPLPRDTPRVVVHHDLLEHRAVAAAVRAADRRADAVVAASHAVARRLRRPDATVLHPGVDLERFHPGPMPPAAPPRALVLGALAPSKRTHVALEIAARVPELHLNVAGASLPGDQAYADALHRRAAAPDLAGRTTFTGALADPAAALRDSHLLLHAGAQEAYGLALVEALASGRPVVAPDAGGPREIVVAGTGALYPPDDLDAAAAAVRATLADGGAPARARAHAEARFAVADSAARFAEALPA